MKQDEIIEMARQTGVLAGYEGEPSLLVIFAKAMMDVEREACAKVCDSEKKWWNGMSHSENDIYQAIDNISACIQARGEA